jgi:hypothetical protein
LPDPPVVAEHGFEVGGMRLYRVPSDNQQLLVLSLEESSWRDMFAKVCVDAISASAEGTPTQALALFLARLEAWRLFLKDVRRSLGTQEIVGLMGELNVLIQILRMAPHALTAWRSPDDGLHDFELHGHALEVKASIGPGHRLKISRLDQLDHSGLARLDLIRVQMAEDPEGFTLGDLIDEVRSLLPDNGVRRTLDNALLRRGLSPHDASAREILRASVQSLNGWCVDGQFPRLIRKDIPSAITEAEYILDVRGLTSWSVRVDELLATFCGDRVDG